MKCFWHKQIFLHPHPSTTLPAPQGNAPPHHPGPMPPHPRVQTIATPPRQSCQRPGPQPRRRCRSPRPGRCPPSISASAHSLPSPALRHASAMPRIHLVFISYMSRIYLVFEYEINTRQIRDEYETNTRQIRDMAEEGRRKGAGGAYIPVTSATPSREKEYQNLALSVKMTAFVLTLWKNILTLPESKDTQFLYACEKNVADEEMPHTKVCLTHLMTKLQCWIYNKKNNRERL